MSDDPHDLRHKPIDGDTDDFECDQCGRRIRARWNGNRLKKEVLQPGDEGAIHTVITAEEAGRQDAIRAALNKRGLGWLMGGK